MIYSTSSRSRLLLAWLLSLGAGLLPGFGQTITTAPGHIESFIEHATQITTPSTTALTYFTVTDASQHSLPNGLPIDFGTTDLGGYRTQSYTVTNSHIIRLTSLTATIDGADAADFVLSSSALGDLAVSASNTFSITYVPELAGKASAAALHLRSVDGSCVYDFPLSATGGNLNPTVRVEEVGGAVVTSLSAPLDFGSPMLGQSTSKTFRITNTGTAPLREVSVGRDDPWNLGGYSGCDPTYQICAFYYLPYYSPTYQFESGFTVTGLSSSVIPPGESRTITVTWKPYETAQKTRNIALSWAMREPPPPPQTYDLTRGSLGQLMLSGTTLISGPILIGNPFVPYTPPVRFSIPVKGAAVPYALAPAPLSGLHYHLGHDSPPGGLSLGGVGSFVGLTTLPTNPRVFLDENGRPLTTGSLTYNTVPDSAELVPETQARWLGYATPTSPTSAYWRSNALYSLALNYNAILVPVPADLPVTTPPTQAFASPLSRPVIGDGSATAATGSSEAVSFFSGTSLRNPNLRLPAADNVGMELWIKPRSLEGAQCVAFMGTNSNTGGFGLWLLNGVPLGLVNGSEAATMVRSDAGPLAADTWHHVAFIIQAAGAVSAPAGDLLAERRTATLYLDGALVGRAEAAGLPALVKGFSIAAMSNGTLPFTGLVDELRLFEIPASGFDPATQLLANAQPATQLAPSSLAFSDTLPGSSTQTATLTNNGPGWLRITSMEVTGDGAADYQVVATAAQPLVPDPTAPPVYPSGGFINIGAVRTLLPSNFDGVSAPIVGQGTSLTYRSTLPPQYQLAATITHTASTLGQRQATLRITTNDHEHPVYEIALNATTVAAKPQQPKLWLSNSEDWDWGTLLTNAANNRTITVSNVGSAPLLSISLEIIGPNAEDVSFVQSSPPIVNGRVTISDIGWSSHYISLNVQPHTSGARFAALRITSDDPERPEIIIPIYGRGVQAVPEIAVAVTGNLGHDDAGNSVVSDYSATLVYNGGSTEFVPVLSGGHHSDQQCRIHNVGTGALEVMGITIDGPDAADFTIAESRIPSGQYGTLMANNVVGTNLFEASPTALSVPDAELPAFTELPNNYEYAILTLRFTPSRVGTHTATLHILSNDADESPYDITLLGEGLKPVTIMHVIDPDVFSNSGTAFTRMGTTIIGGTPTTWRLRLKNVGTLPLTEFNEALTANIHGPQADEFTVVLLSPIAGGAEGDILVSFAPQDIGPRSALLKLTTNEAPSSSYQITLGGTGAYGTRSNLAPMAIPGWVGIAIAELPDGSIVMAGYVAPAEGEAITSKLRIIGKDGSERTSAMLQGMTIIGTVRSIAVLADGSFYIAGSFTGLASPSATPALRQGIARILGDTSDPTDPTATPSPWATTFTPPTGDFTGRAVLALPDGKVLVGGSGSLGGRANLIRLNADGTLDPTFTLPEPNGQVNALAMQDDGKVLVGGEFTNLGTSVPMNNDYYNRMIGGFCRIGIDSSLDQSFVNLGVSQVTALVVREHYIGVAVNLINWRQDLGIETLPAAVVLNLDGQLSSSNSYRFLETAPTTLAMQPDGRLLFTDDYNHEIDPLEDARVNNSNHLRYVLRKVDANISPSNHVWPIERMEGNSTTPIGHVNAILAQSDGKVLLAGDLSVAISPVIDTAPMPIETPLAGFAQLDINGFYHASPIVISPRVATEYAGASPYQNELLYMTTDGLAKIEVSNARLSPSSGVELTPGTVGLFAVDLPQLQHGPVTVTIDGLDAAAFIQAEAPFAITHTAVQWGPQTMYRQFTPTRQGKHRAVLHVHQDGIDNDFDIALEGTGVGTLPDQVRLVDTAGHVFQSTETRDLGSVTFGSTATLDLRLFNDNNGPNSTPFELSITGSNASDFTVSPGSISSIPGSTRNGAGFVPITVTFSPSNTGSRAATLRLVIVTHGPQGDTRSIPFTVNLTGTGTVGAPAITSVPQDVLVMEGEPFSLSAGFEFSQSVLVEWHQQRGSRDSVVRTSGWDVSGSNALTTNSDTLAITSAASTSAGLYRVVASNSAGSTNSRPAQVGVISVLNRDIAVAQGQTANFGVSFTGPPMPPGTSAARYQWRLDGQAVANSASIAGATGPDMALANVTTSQVGAYTCEITLGTASLVTPPIMLSLVDTPQITSLTNIPWRVALPVSSSILTSQAATKFTAQGLPPGVSLNATTGMMSGKPTKAGSYSLRLTASNVSGISTVFTQSVTVDPLPVGIAGSYGCYISRDVTYNDALGGTLALTVAANGSFTGKLRMGSKTSATANPGPKTAKGRLLDYAFFGALELSPFTSDPPSWLATCSVLASSTQGAPALTLGFSIRPSEHLLRFTVQRTGSEPAVLAGPFLCLSSVPAKIAGNYRADIVSDASRPDVNKMSGILSVKVQRNATALWVARLGSEVGGGIVTGSATLSQVGDEPVHEFCGYVFYPHAAGARSLLFGCHIQSYDPKPTVWGVVEWGNLVEAPAPGGKLDLGDLFRGAELSGMKLR